MAVNTIIWKDCVSMFGFWHQRGSRNLFFCLLESVEFLVLSFVATM